MSTPQDMHDDKSKWWEHNHPNEESEVVAYRLSQGDKRDGWSERPLYYSAQPVRKPLDAVTAMRLVLEVDMHSNHTRGTTNWAVAITHAIERAHGITA